MYICSLCVSFKRFSNRLYSPATFFYRNVHFKGEKLRGASEKQTSPDDERTMNGARIFRIARDRRPRACSRLHIFQTARGSQMWDKSKLQLSDIDYRARRGSGVFLIPRCRGAVAASLTSSGLETRMICSGDIHTYTLSIARDAPPLR